jgi:uncharacterized RDD family membrane protein YckC
MIEQPSPAPPVTYAHWWKRAVAFLLDSFILSIPGLLLFIPMIVWFVQHIEEFERTQPPGPPPFPPGLAVLWVLATLVLTAAPIIYFIVMNGGPQGVRHWERRSWTSRCGI